MTQEYYPIDLPGKSLYDKEFNVSIRRITPIEQKFILTLSQKQQRTNKDYIDFIKKLISFDNPEMTFEELYWEDVQYMLYRIRFVTYEKYPFTLNFICDGTLNETTENGEETSIPCTEKLSQKLEIGNLDILTPDDIPNLTTTIHLDTLGEVRIRGKKMKDDLIIDKKMKELKLSEDDLHMRILLLDLCLISEDLPIEQLYQHALDGTLTAEDIIKIEDWFTDNTWGVKEELSVKCPKCGKEALREYFISLEDFFSAVRS